jgi:hypothetical protein
VEECEERFKPEQVEGVLEKITAVLAPNPEMESYTS